MENHPFSADVLILGQGIAGTTLALQLAMSGQSFCILSDPSVVSSSEKAVGLMNPVTGRRMAKTWNYDTLFPFAIAFYREAFEFLFPDQKGSFYKEKPIYKILHSIEEMNFLTGKTGSEEYNQLLVMDERLPLEKEVFSNTLSMCRINHGGRMDPVPYMQAALAFFSAGNAWINEPFSINKLNRRNGLWHYGSLSFKNVVSCLGNGCPWISPELWPVKGQVYELAGLPDWGESILKAEKFLIPTGNGTHLAGSTYEREFAHNNPDEEGFKEITKDLSTEWAPRLSIITSWAGVRPTTKDRRPIMRKIDQGLFALNGLGAKGVSLAPWACREIIRMMNQDS